MSASNTHTCLSQIKLGDIQHVIRLCETGTSAEEVYTTLRVSPTLMSRIMEALQLYETPDTTSVSRKNMTLGDKIWVLHYIKKSRVTQKSERSLEYLSSLLFVRKCGSRNTGPRSDKLPIFCETPVVRKVPRNRCGAY